MVKQRRVKDETTFRRMPCISTGDLQAGGRTMRHGSLFSGLGGFDLAAEWMGWDNVFHCEINEFGRKVLNYYWPESESYEDITTTDFSIWRGRIDILTGGFPCQPYSTAGKRLGKEDERHLWPEMLRVIREVAPKWVVGENVLGLVNWNDGLVFEEVQSDLEAEGYEVQPYVLPAAGVNAPHRRDRVWFVAHSNNKECDWRSGASKRERKEREQRRNGIQRTITRFGEIWPSPDTDKIGLQQQGKSAWLGWKRPCFNHSQAHKPDWENFPTQSPVRGRDDGIPSGLVGITLSKHRNESIKAYGNAIVPQVAYQIFKVIQQYEESEG